MHSHSNAVNREADPFFVALVGSPNSGKTTLYNKITASNHSTVNYPGSTVDYSRGRVCQDYDEEGFSIIDTPGTYSLFPKSPDEKVATDIIYHHPSSGFAKVVVATVDISQLSRQLWIVYQLLEARFQVVVALTMKDMFDHPLDVSKLEHILGCPVVLVSGLTGDGIADLISKIQEVRKNLPQSPTPLVPWSEEKQRQIHIQMVELERAIVGKNEWVEKRKNQLVHQTRKIDEVLLHPVWGLAIFLLSMFFLFTSIFWLATPLMDLVDQGFQWMAESVTALYPHSLWGDFLANGVITSMGSVLVFVPQIMILFFGISLLEDSGYLARACSLIDRPLSKVGLNGRSFVPLLSGNACAIPAMMAARTISSPKEKYLTLLIIPLMSCSARLPVYALLLSFLFWGQPAWNAGVGLAIIYFSSLLVGALVAALGRHFVKMPEPSFLIHELPIYRRPHLTIVAKTVLDRTYSYVRRAGPIIFVLAVLVWLLTTFPDFREENAGVRLEKSYAASLGRAVEPVMSPMGGDWRTGTALISAFAAREVFVSSLSLVLNVAPTEEDQLQASILESMRAATQKDGSPLFTISSVIGLIVFFMIALQCMSTVAVARREFGNWKAPVFQLVIFNVVAYLGAVTLVQVLRAFGIN